MPSLSPSIFMPGQFRRNHVASSQERHLRAAGAAIAAEDCAVRLWRSPARSTGSGRDGMAASAARAGRPDACSRCVRQRNTTSRTRCNEDDDRASACTCLTTPVWRLFQAAAPAAATVAPLFVFAVTTQREIGVLRQGPRAHRATGWRRAPPSRRGYFLKNAAQCLSVFAACADFMSAALGASTGKPDVVPVEPARNRSWARRAAGGARCRAACLRPRRAAFRAGRCGWSSKLLHEHQRDRR